MKKQRVILATLAFAGVSSLACAQAPAFPPLASAGGAPLAGAQARASPPLGTYPTPQWYFGGGAGTGHLNKSASDLTGLNNATLDDNDTAWTIRGGWRFSPFGAVEIGYYDFGRYSFRGTALGNFGPVEGSAKAHSVGVSLVGILPIN